MTASERGPFLLIYALDQQLGTLLSKAMADAPLGPSEYAVYSTLRIEQPTTPSELAGILGSRLTTMSSQLVKMSSRGHLERTRNPSDGRSTLISLTPAGLQVTEACIPSFSTAMIAFRRQLGDQEPAALAALETLSAALARADEEITTRPARPSAP